MSDMIRSDKAGRCALALVVLFGSLSLCLGQEQPAKPPATESQEAPNPDPATPKAAVVPPQEAPPAPATAQPPASTPSPQTTSTPPDASQPAPKGKTPAKKGKSAPSGPGQVTSTTVQTKPYVIGPEDVLYLNVLHQPDVSGNLEVGPDGYVSVRFAGRIKADGLTVEQLEALIAEKLTVYFNHPEVIIQVLRINSKKYYITGEVHRPGAYPLTAPKTIYEALIEAGGPAEFAKSNKIYILRGTQKIPFNWKDVSKGKNLTQNILVQNGDVIMIP